jgi:hypothetical protein
VIAIAAGSVMASAQVPGKPATGNPTPGVAQPDPPNLADRVTFMGCLQPVARAAAATDGNTPSNARFELTRAERVDRVPAGTGGSPATASVSSQTFRLEGIDSQFSPFVGVKVEVSGEINVKSPGAPTLIVEFIQKLAAKC